MIKSIWVFMLSICLACTSVLGLAESDVTVIEAPVMADQVLGIQPGTVLKVGMTTAPSGYFSTNLWGTNGADLAVRALLHDYSTIAYPHSTYEDDTGMHDASLDGSIAFNGMALAGVRTQGNGIDQRTYVFSLMTDLTYNDGTPITAKDYIFSLLMTSSPLIAQLGGSPRDVSQFVGHEAYQTGQSQAFQGVRLLSEDTFSLEIDTSYLPYFYGIALLEITPYPMHVIAPGCDIADDGNGCYITGDFTAALLQKTLLNPETGYVFNPRVTSGAYQLEAYDPQANTVTLVVNPAYLGNYEGITPHVERITLCKVDNESAIDMLMDGQIDLVSELLNGDAVMEGFAHRVTGELEAQIYPRNGLAYLALACEKGATSDVAVRQALAQCINKDAIIEAVSPFATAVHGYYGLGQWMTGYISEEEEDGVAVLNASLLMEESAIAYDVDAAMHTLDAAGWNLNQDGTPYSTGVRYRQGENGLESLTIRWAKTTNQATDKIREIIESDMESAGFELVVTEMPFVDVLEYFYRQKDRTDYDMFFLASDFMEIFDPYYDYHTADEYQGVINTSGLRDEELMSLADAMRKTLPTDQLSYVEHWLAFQQAWIEKMPLIPLYSNVYFDFYTDKVQGYNNTDSLNWGHAALYVWMGEPLDDGDIIMK